MSVFERVWVDNMFKGNTVIYWLVAPQLTDPGPWIFQAQWGRTINDQWTDISTVPVRDGYFTIDPSSHLYGKQIDLYYRVRLVTGAGRTFYSDPARADGGLPQRDWCIAREIIRKEYLNFMKNPDGIKTCLLKRRNWGDRCLHSTDHDTGEMTKPNCAICYDTGIVEGYYPPVEYWILNSQRTQRIMRGDQQGMVGNITMQARAVAYPYVDSGDVLVSADNDRRWFVNTVNKATFIRTKPIILQLELRLAPASNIIYDFPLDVCGIGGSAREPENPCLGLPDPANDLEWCPPVPGE